MFFVASPEQTAEIERLTGGGDIGRLFAWFSDAQFDPQRYMAENLGLKDRNFTPAGAIHHVLTSGYLSRSTRFPANNLPLVLDELLALPIPNQAYKTAFIQSVLLAQRPYIIPKRQIIQALNAERLMALRALGAIPVFLTGDSHSTSYYIAPKLNDGWILPLHYECSGGSASGLANETSRSGYGKTLEKLFTDLSGLLSDFSLPVFFKFGGVDAEFVWNFQRIRDEEYSWSLTQFAAYAEKSVANYMRFIGTITKIIDPRLIRICSIFPPCLSDARWAEGYVNAHIGYLETGQKPEALKAETLKLEIPSLYVRTEMHRIYNEQIRLGTTALGLQFMDDFTPLLDENKVVIAQQYFARHGGRDHHVDGIAVQPVLGGIIQSGLDHTV
jgi:hypothetical protein